MSHICNKISLRRSTGNRNGVSSSCYLGCFFFFISWMSCLSNSTTFLNLSKFSMTSYTWLSCRPGGHWKSPLMSLNCSQYGTASVGCPSRIWIIAWKFNDHNKTYELYSSSIWLMKGMRIQNNLHNHSEERKKRSQLYISPYTGDVEHQKCFLHLSICIEEPSQNLPTNIPRQSNIFK